MSICNQPRSRRLVDGTLTSPTHVLSNVNMMLNVHRNHKVLLGTGRRGEGGMEVVVVVVGGGG